MLVKKDQVVYYVKIVRLVKIILKILRENAKNVKKNILAIWFYLFRSLLFLVLFFIRHIMLIKK